MGDDDAAREDARREYQSSLEDLTFNSKPHINMLTILAEENLHFAKDIVAIIEAQISKAPSSEKLPVLYLVDSIVKNVGGEYLAVFAKNLVTSFICVFEKVDENIRKSLFKLRSTWDDVFPLTKLYALDVRVNSQDSAWPIKPVNASIHVNPKFLKQSEDAPPQPKTPQPPAPPVAAPPPQATPAVSEASLTQEQLIRQQLLAKQKQLLELQQKKIELELEQTKAQLAGGFVLTPAVPQPCVPVVPTTVPKAAIQPAPAPVIRPWIPPNPVEVKPPTRDPRLNRCGPPASKEQSTVNKDGNSTGGPSLTPEKRQADKPSKAEKTRMPKKGVPEEKPKSPSKSPSPMPKGAQGRGKHSEADGPKTPETAKKDPRLRKRTHDKPGEAKEEEQKEKKRFGEKKEKEESPRVLDPQRPAKGKQLNGSLSKHELADSMDTSDFKSSGNARTNARKRTRSRSRSSSPKRKDRRSPKARARSTSSSPTPAHKTVKPRRSHTAEPPHGKPSREDRAAPKKSMSDPKRGKRLPEERHSEGRESHSPRVHLEAKENAHRWRSGWEENKHSLKPSEEPHGKPGPQRHKPYSSSRPSTPRAPKHRLSVDANIQIPDVLNSASKGDLLRRATKRFESGEIPHDEFLAVAHQINQLFQYQEELQRSDSWEAPKEDDSGPQHQFPSKKKPLLSTPGSPRARTHDPMDDAELTYYEHKSKLRRTRVNRRPPGEDWDGDMGSEDGDFEVPMVEGAPGTLAHKYSHSPPERPGERRSKERDEPPPPQQPPAPMIEEYNHGKEFPPLKALPGLRFRRRADPRDSSEREWNSPLTERQREEHKSGYDAPARKFAAHLDPRRPERPPASSTVVLRNCPSPAGAEAPARPLPAPAFERERLSPLPQAEPVESSPVPRFESPNSEHSDDGPLLLDPAAAHLPRHPAPPPRPILKAPPPAGPLASVRQHSGSPGHTPPHDGGYHPPRYDGPVPKGPPRPHPAGPHPSGRYDGAARPGRYDDPGRYDEPGCYDGRFESGGPLPHNMPERFDGQGRYDGQPGPHGPMRGGEGMGRFDGPPRPQGPGRYDGPMGQHPQGRFDGQGPGPMPRFDGPQRFENMGPGGGPGPMGFQQRPQMRFDGPQNQMGPMRFDGPGQMRFDGPGPMYDQGHPSRFEGQQGPQRFGPQMQPQLRPIGPQVCDNAGPPQQNFNMSNHCFPDSINAPQFPGGPLPFPAQQGLPQVGGNFNMQQGPFNQAGAPQFYSPAGPAGNMHQPVNMMSTQPFHPQNPVPFSQPGAQFGAPESHFGQVDVNDLLSKLISTGIIHGSAPVQPDAGEAARKKSTSVPPVAPGPEEEEEEEQEVEDDIPDLTGFLIDTMKLRYESVVTKLYTGIQCYSCGMRFTDSQTDVYADHLDWHYRLNRSEKDVSRKVTHRRWYYTLTDWIEFEEIADLEERAKSLFFEKVNEEVVQKTQEAAKEQEFSSVRATADVVGESCEICQEAFEMYWEEEEEEWHLRDALRVEGKTYHPSCFEDYKNTSSFLDTTPSPNKVLSEHPLSAFIKTEAPDEEEAGNSCVASSVKQEVEAEGGEVKDVKTEDQTLMEDGTPSAVS